MPKYPCTKACPQCESIFTIARAYNRHQKFCSRTCASIAHTTRDKLKLPNCIVCGTSLQASKYQTKFCSRSCAAKYNNAQRPASVGEHHSRVLKEKYSTKVKTCRKCKENYVGEHICNYILMSKSTSKTPYIRCCANCKVDLQDNKKKYCSSCFPNSRHYRSLAQFKFNVYDYPNEFDLNLIHQHGWFSPNGYKSRNKQPNLSGVSRDHLYTVADGFKNKIDAKLLAHPANCAILLHNGAGGNNSKRKSSITLDALHIKIAEWDRKYGQK